MTLSMQQCPGGFCLPFQKESFALKHRVAVGGEEHPEFAACRSPGAACPANSTVLWEWSHLLGLGLFLWKKRSGWELCCESAGLIPPGAAAAVGMRERSGGLLPPPAWALLAREMISGFLYL